jgi:hypothetical protein
LKENVIMGRLVPAGTGLDKYQGLGIQVEAPEGQLVVDSGETTGQALEDGGLSETPVEEPTVQLDPGILEG